MTNASDAVNPPLKFRLHHVGVVVPDLEVAVQQHIERFGFLVESESIVDVSQTAVVRFLRLPGQRHWTELVAPVGTESKLHGALRRGGGTNHLCYEVPSLARGSDHLREHGMLPVGTAQPGVAFGGRQIAWFMDRAGLLIELLESGPGALSLESLERSGT